MNNNTELIKDLLNIKAVQINLENYFTWTSGIKSPIYCDNRLTMSYPHVRKKITKAFIHMIDDLEVKPDIIAGCATAGIPHAAWLADALDLPMIYVRTTAKGHGKGNQIEGQIERGKNVLVIEDLISTGGSSIQVADALSKEGMHVIKVLAIFTYGLNKAIKQFAEHDISFQTILSFDQLLEALIDDGKMKQEDKENLLQWRNTLQ